MVPVQCWTWERPFLRNKLWYRYGSAADDRAGLSPSRAASEWSCIFALVMSVRAVRPPCRLSWTALAALLMVAWTTWVITFQAGLTARHVAPQAADATAPTRRERGTATAAAGTAAAAAAADLHSPVASRRSSSSSPPPPPSPSQSCLECPRDCHAMAQTELPGDVVRWGADHKPATAAGCCAACRTQVGCNTWVFCADARQCGARHRECWLKKRAQPYEDVDLLSGRSTLWVSGVLGEPPAAATGDGGGGTACDFALLTLEGRVRLRLRPQAKSASAYVSAILAERAAAAAPRPLEAPLVDPARPVRDGLRFYRAEPVPAHWGSLEWPDTWAGGRWGPPYSLLQGSLRPSGSRVRPASADAVPGAKPVIRRGMVAWAGGSGGPDFFVALAQHPEWGNGHTVWAEVLPADMAVIDAIMRRPLRVANWGSINATELITPVPFHLLGPEACERR